MWKTTVSVETTSNVNGFWKAINVLIDKPHVINRRICGTSQIYRASVKNIHEFLCFNILEQEQNVDFNFLRENLTTIFKNDFSEFQSINSELEVIIRRNISKNLEKYNSVLEIVILDHIQNAAYFIPMVRENEITNHLPSSLPEVTYKLTWTDDFNKQTTFLTLNIAEDGPNETVWLQNHLFSKFKRWTEEEGNQYKISSLQLVDIEEYNALYQHLKKKYGHKFIENWPEQTDPLKFVYEDVAIAAYLLILWKVDREEKAISKLQSFVDLGCGNGLLVHILSTEGHPGLGIDIRKRKIWDLYGPETILKEMSVIPSNQSLFPDYDWLLGNHSDELTPWIPVIAARSSYNCNFFLLPCCAYDFYCKFQHKKSGTSLYRCYLDFVAEVGRICGFLIEEDVLRIPSTKRACFVGRKRCYLEIEKSSVDMQIQEFISSRTKKENNSNHWKAAFQPRPIAEKIQNCSKVDSDLIKKIVLTAFQALLDQEQMIEVEKEGNELKLWNRGGILPLSHIAKFFDSAELQKLKNECGGIQTLLRNHPHIFQVSGGSVQLRFAKNVRRQRSKIKCQKSGSKLKTKLCWFYVNHPHGCFQKASNCSFSHGEEDLITHV